LSFEITDGLLLLFNGFLLLLQHLFHGADSGFQVVAGSQSRKKD
jgi:hypothetical protein